MKKLAVLTPTYNRANLLNRVYDSLKNQTNKNFVWYVVDDGSKDNTKQIIDDCIKENKIEIKYFYKENGGKHTALNFGLKEINEDFTIILDSDDALSLNACETILNDIKKVQDDDFCGLGYLRGDFKGKVVGNKYTQDEIVDTFINQRYNKNTFGDKAEVFKTNVLKEYPFPVFSGEKFLSESTVWCKISLKYKMLFINKIVYNCEYQVGGLSDNVRRTLFKNPKGACECYKQMTNKKFNLKQRCKFILLYTYHGLVAKYKVRQLYKNCGDKFLFCLLFPFSLILKLIRTKKYKKY